MNILIPPPRYCVDNGVMVAWTGLERLLEGLWDEPPGDADKVQYFTEVRPKWPLGVRDEKSSDFKNEISRKMREKDQAKKYASKDAKSSEGAEVDGESSAKRQKTD